VLGVSTWATVHGARKAIRHAFRRAHQARRGGRRSDEDQEALRYRPGRGDRMVRAVGAHLGVDALRRGAQGELAQRDQVALAEEAVERALRLLGDVDLALLEAEQEVFGREIDELDLVGALEHRVGHGLAYRKRR
jgi:hypothetical protein